MKKAVNYLDITLADWLYLLLPSKLSERPVTDLDPIIRMGTSTSFSNFFDFIHS